MNINKNSVYNFLFHPFSEKHSLEKKVCASVALIALSILSGFTYLAVFIAVQLKDRNIQVQKVPAKISALGISVLTPKIDDDSLLPPIAAPMAPVAAPKIKADMQKLELIKKQHKKQLEQFEKWAKNEDWRMFSHQHSHYDWWIFPISRPSSYGTKYSVYEPEIAILKADPEFMRDFRRGAELVALSWGWDIKTGCAVANPKPSQKWDDWPVRLGKMANSLQLFGEEYYRANMKAFAEKCVPLSSLEDWAKKSLGILPKGGK